MTGFVLAQGTHQTGCTIADIPGVQTGVAPSLWQVHDDSIDGLSPGEGRNGANIELSPYCNSTVPEQSVHYILAEWTS